PKRVLLTDAGAALLPRAHSAAAAGAGAAAAGAGGGPGPRLLWFVPGQNCCTKYGSTVIQPLPRAP
ncbi:hypothetical protein, partial [Streptomyces sp. NPDC059668]|uniref:hypothetical protein n=1 Tax=Streptomyces sp. NPDC059668 TaxID=3346900 RepID=UPI00368AD3DE